MVPRTLQIIFAATLFALYSQGLYCQVVHPFEQYADSVYEAFRSGAEIDLNEVEVLAKQFPDDTASLGIEKLWRILATHYINRGRQDLAFRHLLKIQDNQELRGDTFNLAMTLAAVGECLRAFEKNESADSVLQQAIRFGTKTNNIDALAYANARLANSRFEVLKDSSRCLPYMRHAISLLRKLNYRVDLFQSKVEYAAMVRDFSNPTWSVNYLRNLRSEIPDSVRLILWAYNLAKAFEFSGAYDSAIYYAGISYRVSKKFEIPVYRHLSSEVIHTANFKKQNYKDAYIWSLIYDNELVSFHKMIGGENVRIAQLEAEKKLQRQRNSMLDEQNQALAQSIRFTNNLIIGISVLSLILIVIAGFFYVQRKKTQLVASQLTDANTRLESANEKLGQVILMRDKLLKALTHDLRTPLASVRHFIEMIRDRETDESEKQMLDLLEEQNNRSLEMADNLILWVRSQMNGVEPDKKRFDLCSVIEETVNLLREQAGKKKVEIKVGPCQHHEVFADCEMIKFIVRNLLTNAVKHSPEGAEVCIEVLPSEREVLVVVSDSGPGIEPEKLKSIFDQAKYITQSGGAGGAGVALNLCKTFAEMNDSRLWAESQPGMGSSFFLAIPKYQMG
ncbi:MAG: hypothetical protein Kow0075_14190 [Salibacteraceae bacterium]